jgi:two-component system, NarL family, nitrate/nitrite response regulator NarL
MPACEIGLTPDVHFCGRQTQRGAQQGWDQMDSLTSREREIVLLLALGGLSNKEVGRRLNLSEGTVKVHLHNVYSKLGVKNRTALAVLALY